MGPRGGVVRPQFLRPSSAFGTAALFLLGIAAAASDATRLREAALAEPGVSACHLVYADWLEEHEYTRPGSLAHAEIIRLDAALDRLPGSSPERNGLEARRRAILDEYGKEWAARIALPLERIRFVGGYARGLTATPTELWDNRRAFSRLPLSTLKVRTESSGMGLFLLNEMARLPELARVFDNLRRLDLSGFRGDLFKASDWAYRVKKLEALDLSGHPFPPELAASLATNARGYPALRELRVSGPVDADTRRLLTDAFARRPGWRLEIVD